MIEIAILYVLNKYDATIYRISKIIDEFFFAFLKSSSGTINPALKRLEKMGCVECCEKMSDGGLLSKIYSITPAGKKHLIFSLLNFEFSNNPYHILNEIKIALYASDILSINETLEFKENILNHLELFKIRLQKGLENEYITINEIQKQTVKITISEIENLVKIL